MTGRSDVWFSAWVLAHMSRALVSGPLSIPDAGIYYPTPDTLFYGPAPWGAIPYFLPTFVLTGNPALALNLMFLGCLALTAWATHLVVHHWTTSHAAGVVAASTFLSTRWVLWSFVSCVPYYAVLLYFPLLVLLTARPSQSVGKALRVVPVLVLQCLTSVYVAVAALIPVAVLAVARLTRPVTRAAGVRLSAALAVSMLLLLPFYGPYLLIRRANSALDRQTFWPVTLESEMPFGPFSYGSPVAVPLPAFVVIAAGALLLARRRVESGATIPAVEKVPWRGAAFWSVTGVLISLSPVVHWNGHVVELPHATINAWLPFYDVIRTPARLGVAGLFGLAVLAGVAFAECLRAAGRLTKSTYASPFLTLLVLALMNVEYAYGTALPFLGALRSQTYFAHITRPDRLFHVPAQWLVMGALPRFYPLVSAIAPESALIGALRERRGPLLEVPTTDETIEAGLETPGGSAYLQARAMYRSIFHRRPLLNGYSSYWPAPFEGRMDLARRLPDSAALQALRAETDLDSIVVHFAELSRPERRRWAPILYAKGCAGLRLMGRFGNDAVFQVVDESAELSPAEHSREVLLTAPIFAKAQRHFVRAGTPPLLAEPPGPRKRAGRCRSPHPNPLPRAMLSLTHKSACWTRVGDDITGRAQRDRTAANTC